MQVIAEISVCVDCLIMIANGDVSGIDNEDRIAEVIAGMDRLTTDGAHLVAGDSDDGNFRWTPCECCGSELGGDRHAAVLLSDRQAERPRK